MKKKKLLIAMALGSALWSTAQCPTASFTTSAPACKNEFVSFTNTSGNTGGGWNYQWDFDFGGNGNVSPQTSNSQNPTSVWYNGGGSYTVSFTISGNGCPPSTATMIIDIEKARADFGVSATQVCEGETVTFYNTGSSQGNNNTNSTVSHFWDFGAGAVPATSTQENPPAVTYTTPGAKNVTHYVTVQYNWCGKTKTKQVSQTIMVNPKPTVTFSSTAPVCENSAVDFTYTGTASSTDQYAWDFGNNAVPALSTAQNPTGIIYTTPGTKTVTLTVTNQYGCSNTTTQNITINAKPVANFSTTAPQCTGLPVNFTNTGTPGINYSWNFGSGASPATSTVENPTNVVYSTAGTKNITLIVNNGSCSDTMYQTLTIHQTPSVNFTSTAPQCVGTGVNFTNVGTTGTNWQYTWDFGQDAQPTVSNSENPTGVVYLSGGTKSVTLTINDQNCSNSFTNTININALPMVFAGNDTTICANDTIQIGTASVSGYTYQWYPSNNLVISNPTISNPNATPVSDVTTYIVTVTDQNNCVNTDSVIVTMLSPILADAGVDVAICRYDSIQIGAALIEGQHYVWTPAKGIDNAMSPNPVVSPDSTTTYTVTVSNEYNCPTESDQVTVIVHQLPLANAGVDDTITIGSQVQLIATGGVQYSWSPAYGLDNIGIYNPIASPDSTTEYVVQVIDIYGCINYDTIVVNVLAPKVWVPTAFTPDDVYNNIFYVRGQGVQNFKFRIFNRNGELLFVSESMNQGWNGTRQLTGEKLPQGAYIYDVQGVLTSGEVLHKTGVINLIR